GPRRPCAWAWSTRAAMELSERRGSPVDARRVAANTGRPQCPATDPARASALARGRRVQIIVPLVNDWIHDADKM
ncbi:hypothetical protein, partial [Rhodanobacter sp. FW510-R10]|uniref:hypothetical protein n=1 Tax=Rhodanobacter sp. FW510-R10 TaxID=1524462 RepID=UPI001F403608